MSALILGGCGGNPGGDDPTRLPGALTAVSYSRTVGMVWGDNYSVRVTSQGIEAIEYFDEQDSEYRELENVSLPEERWQQVEAAVLEAWPGLTEFRPRKKTLWDWVFAGVEPLDGGDSTKLSLAWETPEGIVSMEYNWKHDDPKVQQLFTLLTAFQNDVKGE